MELLRRRDAKSLNIVGENFRLIRVQVYLVDSLSAADHGVKSHRWRSKTRGKENTMELNPGANINAAAGVYVISATVPGGGTFDLNNYSLTFSPGIMFVGTTQGSYAYDQFGRFRDYMLSINRLIDGSIEYLGEVQFNADGSIDDGRMAGSNSFKVFGNSNGNGDGGQ